MGTCKICDKDVLIEDLYECEDCHKDVCADCVTGQKISEDDFQYVCVECLEEKE